MNKFVVVDTDILIDVGRGVEQAVAYLSKYEEITPLAISSITQMELIVGCRNKAELRQLERFVERFSVLQVTQKISDAAVKLLKGYRLSHGLLIADALIAATALTNDFPLASKNQKDYRFIDNLDLLPYD